MRQPLKMLTKREGQVANAHLRSLYPMPEMLGAEELEVCDSATRTSSLTMLWRSLVGRGRGLSGWDAETGEGMWAKNLACRMPAW